MVERKATSGNGDDEGGRKFGHYDEYDKIIG